MNKFLLCFLALPLGAFAQPVQNALLWRISPSNGGTPSYLLGTVHSRDARAYAAIDLAERVMQDCQAVYGELDLAATASARESMASHVLMPGGKSLKDLYSPRRYKRVEKAIRGELGPLAPMVAHVKPILISAMLTEESMSKDSALVLDQYLQTRALDQGRRTGGIETIEEQLAAMDAVPLKEQADMLYETVRAKGSAKDMEELLDAYARQDLTRIGELMEDGSMSDAFARPLLRERNVVMTQRIDSLLRQGPALFAIGAAHLSGQDGVLERLRMKGATIEPVTAEMFSRPSDPIRQGDSPPAR